MSTQDPHHPSASPELVDVPAEEDVSTADAIDRLDRDPEHETNATDPQEIARRTDSDDS
jgi:hypothetical protein